MTGTGTQADPYIVDNWPDFVTAIGTSGAYVTFPDTPGVIDLNDVAPEGVTSKITTNCVSIDGKGWSIRNLYSKGAHDVFEIYGNNLTIDALHFLNLYVDFQGGSNYCLWHRYSGSGNFVSINNSKFSGIFTNAGSNSSLFHSDGSWERAYITSCAFNVKLDSGICIMVGDVALSYFNYTTYKLSGNSSSQISGKYFNCLFTGESASTSVSLSSGSNYNVFDVDFTGATSFSCSAPSGSLNLINSDKLPTGATVGTGFVGVTTAQLGDAAYLASLGFPIVEG